MWCLYCQITQGDDGWDSNERKDIEEENHEENHEISSSVKDSILNINL